MKRGLLRWLTDRLFGYDVFISYRRKDGTAYAAKLRELLEERDFSVFFDADDYVSGDNWRSKGVGALRRSSTMVLVGSPDSLESEPVAAEVRTFVALDRRVVPIEFDECLSAPGEIRGLMRYLDPEVIRLRETGAALASGPSARVLEEIQRTFTFRRQAQRRARWIGAVMTLMLMLAAVGAWSWWQSRREEAGKHVEAAGKAAEGDDLLAELGHLRAGLAAMPPFDDRTAAIERRIAHLAMSVGPELAHPSGQVLAATYSPDGTRVLTAGTDGSARIWDAASGDELATLVGHDASLSMAAWKPDGAQVVTASFDKTGRRWDAATGAQLELYQHDGNVRWACFSPDGGAVATASYDGTVRVWREGVAPLVLQAGGQSTRVIWLSGGKRLAASVDARGAAALEYVVGKIWDVASGEVKATLRGPPTDHAQLCVGAREEFLSNGRAVWRLTHSGARRVEDEDGHARTTSHAGAVLCADLSSDRRLVSAAEDGTVITWEASDLEQRQSFRHEARVKSVRFSRTGAYILTASEDRSVTLWAAGSGRALWRMRGAGKLQHASFRPDEGAIVTCGEERVARIWHVRTGASLHWVDARYRQIRLEAVSPDGTRALTSLGGIWLWMRDVEKGTSLWGPDAEDLGDPELDGLHVARFHPDGSRLVLALRDGLISVRETETGAKVHEFPSRPKDAPAGDGTVLDMALSPDGTRLATLHPGACRVWTLATGEAVGVWNTPHVRGGRVSFDPTGTRVLTRAIGGAARLWNVASPSPLLEADHMRSNAGYMWVKIAVASFRPDGGVLATSGDDGHIRFWDTSSGKEVETDRPIADDGPVFALQYRPDGEHLVVGRGGKRGGRGGGGASPASVWHLGTRQRVWRCWHDDYVSAVAYAPDGCTVALAVEDGTVQSYSAKDGTPLGRPNHHPGTKYGRILNLAFAPDGSRFVTVAGTLESHSSTRAWIWRMP